MQAWMALIACALLAAAAPAVGDEVGAGASGQCWNTAGEGGADEARVALDTEDLGGATVVVPSGTGAAEALLLEAAFLTGTGPGCNNPRTYDYVEVDVTAGGSTTQVCYDGGDAPRTDGACPTSPSGLPA